MDRPAQAPTGVASPTCCRASDEKWRRDPTRAREHGPHVNFPARSIPNPLSFCESLASLSYGFNGSELADQGHSSAQPPHIFKAEIFCDILTSRQIIDAKPAYRRCLRIKADHQSLAIFPHYPTTIIHLDHPNRDTCSDFLSRKS